MFGNWPCHIQPGWEEVLQGEGLVLGEAEHQIHPSKQLKVIDLEKKKKKKTSANAKKKLSIQLYKSQAEPNHKQEINILTTESKEINDTYPHMQNIYSNISLKFLLR